MPHGPFAKRRRSPAAYGMVWLHSPEGTEVNSRRRQPTVFDAYTSQAPLGGPDRREVPKPLHPRWFRVELVAFHFLVEGGAVDF